jgi:hypothetical protein
MKLNRTARFALLAIALALLVAGLAGPVRRAAEQREKARAAAEMREKVEADRVVRAGEYVTRRDQVLADARAAIDRRDYAAALKIVSPYAGVPDEALRELFREAAGAESVRQRTEAMVALVARDCTEGNVRDQVAAMLEKSVEPGVTGEPPRSAVRLTGAEAREVVLARMREPIHAERPRAALTGKAPPPQGAAGAPPAGTAAVAPPAQPVDWVSRMRAGNRARPLPDYLGMVYSPASQDVMCVWRIEGRRHQDVRTFAYTIDVWMAPVPDSKGLAADPVRYTERVI